MIIVQTQGSCKIAVQTQGSCNIVQTQGSCNFNLTSTGKGDISELLLYIHNVVAVWSNMLSWMHSGSNPGVTIFFFFFFPLSFSLSISKTCIRMQKLIEIYMVRFKSYELFH